MIVSELAEPGSPQAQARAVAEAVESGQIIPWYQPQIDLVTGTVVGFEALARWALPDGEVRTPDSFVPIAERSQLIVDLDQSVMRRALLDLDGWHRDRPRLRVSVNLSGRHLDRRAWVSILSGAARESGVDPSLVDLELSETARPGDPRAAAQALQRARDLGFRVLFDDFGSGWSALRDLLRLPVDGVKFDRGFAALLGTRTHDTVVGALARALDDLGLSVTMEGIERPDQAVRARELGCHLGQGYLWARPMPAADVSGYLDGAPAAAADG